MQMRKDIVRYALGPAAVLVAALGLDQALHLGLGPLPVFLAVLVIACALYAVVKFPAAFIVPVLFIPQDKPLPFVAAGLQDDVTALAVAVALLIAAILFRLTRDYVRGTSGGRRLLDLPSRGIKTYFLFAAVIAISYTYTHAPDYGGEKLLTFVTIDALCFFSPFVLIRDEKDLRDFTLAAVAIALVSGAGRFATADRGSYAQHEEITHIGIGQLIGMAILLALNFRFVESRAMKWLVLACVPLLAIGMVAAEARGPIFSLIFVMGLLSFSRQTETRPLVSYRILTVAALGALALLVTVPPSWVRGEAASMMRAKKEELVKLAEGEDSQASGGRRLDFYRAALAGIAEKPLLGWGVGGWSDYYFHTDDRHYPHNLVLEAGFEEGLLGLAALAAFLLTAFAAARRVFREGGATFACLFPVLLYCFLVAMTSGDINDERFLWFWSGAALAIYGLVRSRAEDEEIEAAAAEAQPVETLG